MLHAGAINWTYTLGVGVVDPLRQRRASHPLQRPRGPGGLAAPHRNNIGATIFAAVPGVYRQILK